MLKVMVDGNNVLQALGIMRPEQAEAFLIRLELAAAHRDWEVTVVFDGPERFLPRETGLLVVRYAKGSQADTLIERMAYQAADRKQVVVVTQDHAEADLVRGLGASVWTASRLQEELG